MKKTVLSLILVLGISTAFAQTDPAARYATVITGNGLNKHLNIVASAEMQGRETGTEGQRKAAAYIESQFKAMGLQPAPSLNGYQQYYPLYQDSLLTTTLSAGGKDAVFGTDFISPMNSNENGKFKGKTN